MPHKKEQHKPSNNFWITKGIFSSHYLLERLPQAGTKSGIQTKKCSHAH